MNVYFDNVLERNVIPITITPTPSPGYSLDRLFSPYLHYGVLIEAPYAQINLQINGQVTGGNAVVLISGESIERAHLTITGVSGAVIEEEHSIVFEQLSYVLPPSWREDSVHSITIEIYGGSFPMIVNSIYVGPYLTIPNMVSAPEVEDDLFSKMERSYDGYALGYERTILEQFSAEFANIPNDELRKIRNEYVLKVGNTVPHWIDPYPEADDKFSAFWGTLNMSKIKYKKREKRFPFFWDVELSWTEAK